MNRTPRFQNQMKLADTLSQAANIRIGPLCRDIARSSIDTTTIIEPIVDQEELAAYIGIQLSVWQSSRSLKGEFGYCFLRITG